MTTATPAASAAAHHGASVTVRRTAAMGLAAVVLASLHLTHRPPTLCLLRMLTGVPCPLCGGTTAAVRFGHLNVRGALAANPFVVVAAAGFALLPVVPRQVAARWHSLAPLVRLSVVVAVIVGSELWQLARFGWLS